MAIDPSELARRIRRHAVRMTNRARSAHVGTALSAADLLAVLYGRWLRLNPCDPQWPERDRFILSKGHGCAALYAALAERGFFPPDWLDGFYSDGSRLIGHAASSVPGVEVSTGALGHGLAVACGMALSAKHDRASYRVVAMLSDGECDEGSTWEAVLFAPHHGLDNLSVVVDYNRIQSLGDVKDVLDLEPFAEKWTSFGWSVRAIDGHDLVEIENAFQALPFTVGRPSCILAHTVKGKGVSFMENKLLWHYRSPNDDELGLALSELDVQR